MVPRPVYKKILKSVSHYEKQDDKNGFPIDWEASLRRSIERILREGRQPKEAVNGVFESLVREGRLIHHPLGGYMFPRKDVPSREELMAEVQRLLNKS